MKVERQEFEVLAKLVAGAPYEVAIILVALVTASTTATWFFRGHLSTATIGGLRP
jgi:hypothetical protein